MTAATPPLERTAYLVLGMHRSGTSAATQLLALAGAHLPENVMPGDEHNERGYFEPWRIAMFNDRRLRAGGGAWDDVFAFPHRPLPHADERAWLNDAAAMFGQEYEGAARPLLKDPRVSLLLPLWRIVLEDLGVAARCMIPVRNPLAVAGSLSRRNGFAIEKSLLLWSVYMLAAEAYSRDLPRVFVGYDALLADWRGEFARMQAVFGPGLPPVGPATASAIDAFLTPDLRHNAGAEDFAPYGWAGALTQSVYGWFVEAARGQSPSTAPLEAAGEVLVRRRDEFGVLVSPVTRDLDATRLELNELRQIHAAEQERLQALEAERHALTAQLAGLRAEHAQAATLVDSILAR